MALSQNTLMGIQQLYGQRMRGPMGDAAFDDGSNIQAPEGNVGAGAAGFIGLGTQLVGNANRNKNINTSSPGSQVDAYGKPTYNLGSFAQSIDSIKTSVNGGNIANATAQGAIAGSAIPVIGTFAGAAIGLVGSTASELFASDAAKRKKKLATQSLANAQRAYNSQISQYNNMEMGQQQYQDLMNPESRMYNLYRATTPT